MPAETQDVTVSYQYLNADECEVLKMVKELDTDHLENILITQPQLPNLEAATILMILKDRYVTGWIGVSILSLMINIICFYWILMHH
jgi:hypothetical protein